MNGTDILVDTNLLIRYLAGDNLVQHIIVDNEVFISFISKLEMLSKSGLTPSDEEAIGNLIAGATPLIYKESFKPLIIQIRRTARLKLPDAIIAATALHHRLPLITADTDFKRIAALHLILI